MDRTANTAAERGARRARALAGSRAHVLHGDRAEAAVLELPGTPTAVVARVANAEQILPYAVIATKGC